MRGHQSGRERVGIVGGTFDPIHLGHLGIAQAARKQHRLDRVIFVAARRQPMKQSDPVASGEQRLAMVELAIAGRPGFSASGCELTRPGTSFTIDTVREHRAKLGAGAELFFVLGSDNVPDLPNWRALEELAELCTLVVAARPGWPLDALDVLEARLTPEQVGAIKAAAVRHTANAASASEVRSRVARGEPVDGLVPPAVAGYIAQNKLYRTT